MSLFTKSISHSLNIQFKNKDLQSNFIRRKNNPLTKMFTKLHFNSLSSAFLQNASVTYNLFSQSEVPICENKCAYILFVFDRGKR